MAFFESPRFPDGIALGSDIGPEFTTEIASAASGREVRDTPQPYPRIVGDISPGVKTATQFAVLRPFFWVAQGRLNAWRLRDPTDHAFAHSGTETGVVRMLTSTTFQLFKRYSSGAQTFDRKIRKPVAGTLNVQVSGAPVTFTVDTTTGIITIASAPSASAVTVSGEFDVPMRFDVDRLAAPTIARHPDGLVQSWVSVPVVEVLG